MSRLPPAAPQATLLSHRNRCPRRDGRLLRQARAAYGGAQACAAVSAAPGSAAAGQGGHFRRHSDIPQLSGASASQPAARPGPALGGRRCGAGEGPGRLRACLGPPSSSGSRLPGIMPPGRLRPLSHGGRERGPVDKGGAGAGAHGPPRCGPQQVVHQCWAGLASTRSPGITEPPGTALPAGRPGYCLPARKPPHPSLPPQAAARPFTRLPTCTICTPQTLPLPLPLSPPVRHLRRPAPAGRLARGAHRPAAGGAAAGA